MPYIEHTAPGTHTRCGTAWGYPLHIVGLITSWVWDGWPDCEDWGTTVEPPPEIPLDPIPTVPDTPHMNKPLPIPVKAVHNVHARRRIAYARIHPGKAFRFCNCLKCNEATK